MIRVITYTMFYVMSIAFTQAQTTTKEVVMYNDSIELPGTLTTPSKATNLIIWVHGSGNIDRNGNQAVVGINANYIKQFRDSINKKGIAFFSFDKRTSNPKNAKLLKGTLLEDFVKDVKKIVDHFKQKNQFKNIVLAGHSQGSLIAMLASEGIDKYISIAGAGDNISEAIYKQLNAQSPPLAEAAKAHFKELKETGEIKEVNPMLMSLFAKPNQPFFKSWMQYNPTEEIKKLKIPTLIIQGENDLQVKKEDAQKLHAALTNSKLVVLPKMNHVLKDVNSIIENQQSYLSADFPLSKELINSIVEFVNN